MARSPTETIRFLTLDEFARLLAVMRGHPRDRHVFLDDAQPSPGGGRGVRFRE